jgi:hypothetical protein
MEGHSIGGDVMREAPFALCIIVILATVATGGALAGNLPPFIEEGVFGHVRYVSGGVSLEEREAMKAMAKDFDLKLVFAMASGEYLSHILVVIKDAQGNTLLSKESQGPWFFVKLPE